MARVKVIVTNYGFKKPPLMSEGDFKSYKQIFQIEALHDLAPKTNFWIEFAHIKWGLIILICGIPLALIWDSLAFIPGLAFLLLIISMVTGTAQSMINYQSFLNVKKLYYQQLKQTIITSSSYV